MDPRARGDYAGTMMSPSLNVLIIEDEPIIAMMLADMLDLLGHRVAGHAETLEAAYRLIEAGRFDAAILDVYLAGQPVWPIAERLRADGCPFVLATGAGRDDLPAAFQDCLVLEKPYDIPGITRALETFCSA